MDFHEPEYDEVGQLAREIKRMRRELEDLKQQVEDKIAEIEVEDFLENGPGHTGE